MAARLSDSEAKVILTAWPLRPRDDFFPGGPWLRAQPKDGATTGPRLLRPATDDFSARTQPDGLWLAFNAPPGGGPPVAVSTFVVEVCRTMQNLNDKRSRFASAHAALLVEVPAAWLQRSVPVQGGATPSRYGLAGFAVPPTDDLYLPVRSVRVLYALPNDVRAKPTESRLFSQQKGRLALEAHEYLTRHSALGHTNAPTRRLVRSALASHVA